MARASITIVLPEVEDDKAIEVKKQIEELLKEVPNVTVSIHISPR